MHIQFLNELNNQYIDVFGNFSWVITEFASSSVGGDKSAWITSMFENIKNYSCLYEYTPNSIKTVIKQLKGEIGLNGKLPK
mgnify:CR=1 FL=1